MRPCPSRQHSPVADTSAQERIRELVLGAYAASEAAAVAESA
jgi:hypothetical protein